MKTCIICEKPSVAREIAAIAGATNKEDGFLYGNGYTVTWALGHLLQLAMPDDYGFAGFVRESLPIIPKPFILKPRQIKDGKEYKPDGGALRQLKIIGQLFNRCDKIIVASDAGREGELIFRYIYGYLGCNKPFERLWINSLTDRAIRNGLQNLKPGSRYDNLYYAAKARAEADWAVGINATQALSIAAGRGIFSLGRVQTPTLAMICKRFVENRNFTPTSYWQLKIQTEKADISFFANGKERHNNMETANKIFGLLQEQKKLCVQSVETKEVHQEPPLLYDLTTLQKEANTGHSFSADKTLSIAQRLYESHKLITYPRTSSRYISQDFFDEIPQLVNSLKSHPCFGACASSMDTIVPNVPCINDQKVTDHHALLITGYHPKELTLDEQILYDMIAGRMLESFSPKCIKDATTITLTCGDAVFETKSSLIKQAGWRAVFNKYDEKGDEERILPSLREGEQLPVIHSEILEKQTKPKPLHTEASLLTAMENAGLDVENEAEREAMRESGIGTPATRAAIIETLLARDYILREKKSLLPTEKGLFVYETSMI